MDNKKLSRISELVADAVNQDSLDSLEDDLEEELAGLPDGERDEALGKAYVISVMASQPGCLPDSWGAYPMDASPDDIREEIMSLMGEDDFDDDEIDWDAQRERVNDLNLAGDSIDAPDGRVIEVFRRSCADVLDENGIGV